MPPTSFKERSEILKKAYESLTKDSYHSYRDDVTSFLEEYPYCYEYWKKLANATLQHASLEEALPIYQKAIDTIPYCWQLWSGYLDFAKKCSQASKYASVFTKDVIIQLYKLALSEYVGETYMSTTLWIDFLNFLADQLLASDEKDDVAINELLDTYSYLLSGESRIIPSSADPVYRAHAADLLSLHHKHVGQVFSKWPAAGDLDAVLAQADATYKKCYSTSTAGERLALYECLEKRPFYHHSSFKADILTHFRTLFRELMKKITASSGDHWAIPEAHAILCVCCDHADFWILFIRTLVQVSRLDDASEACSAALTRCHGGFPRAYNPVFYIEKLQVLELSRDEAPLPTLVLKMRNEFASDPLVALALGKYYYRKKQYTSCIELVSRFFETPNLDLPTSLFTSLVRLLSMSLLAKVESSAEPSSREQELTDLECVFIKLETLPLLRQDCIKALAIEQIIVAQKLYILGYQTHFVRIKESLCKKYSGPENTNILEAVFQNHIQWLQIHGSLAEIYEAETILLHLEPSYIYQYADCLTDAV